MLPGFQVETLSIRSLAKRVSLRRPVDAVTISPARGGCLRQNLAVIDLVRLIIFCGLLPVNNIFSIDMFFLVFG